MSYSLYSHLNALLELARSGPWDPVTCRPHLMGALSDPNPKRKGLDRRWPALAQVWAERGEMAPFVELFKQAQSLKTTYRSDWIREAIWFDAAQYCLVLEALGIDRSALLKGLMETFEPGDAWTTREAWLGSVAMEVIQRIPFPKRCWQTLLNELKDVDLSRLYQTLVEHRHPGMYAFLWGLSFFSADLPPPTSTMNLILKAIGQHAIQNDGWELKDVMEYYGPKLGTRRALRGLHSFHPPGLLKPDQRDRLWRLTDLATSRSDPMTRQAWVQRHGIHLPRATACHRAHSLTKRPYPVGRSRPRA